MALKHKKKLITTATEQFNAKPSKGIAYMQECKLMDTPPDVEEIVRFMRQNPHLDKNMLGEYISNRKNLDILKAYVKSFDFQGLRLDESLRMFLEAFRFVLFSPFNFNFFCTKYFFYLCTGFLVKPQ